MDTLTEIVEKHGHTSDKEICPVCGESECQSEMCNLHYMRGNEEVPQVGDEDCQDFWIV